MLWIPIFDSALETNSSYKMKFSSKNKKSLQATTPLASAEKNTSSNIFLAKQISFATTQMKNVTTSPEVLCSYRLWWWQTQVYQEHQTIQLTPVSPPAVEATFLIHYLSHSLPPERTADLAAAKTDSLLSHQLPTQLFSSEQHRVDSRWSLSGPHMMHTQKLNSLHHYFN